MNAIGKRSVGVREGSDFDFAGCYIFETWSSDVRSAKGVCWIGLTRERSDEGLGG